MSDEFKIFDRFIGGISIMPDNNLNRVGEVLKYQSSFHGGELYAGFETSPLWKNPDLDSVFPLEGRLSFTLGPKLIFEDGFLYGNHSIQGVAKLGFTQQLFPWLIGKVHGGVAYGSNRFELGSGVKPKEEDNFIFSADFLAGIKIRHVFGATLNIAGGLALERGISPIAFDQKGLKIDIGFDFDEEKIEREEIIEEPIASPSPEKRPELLPVDSIPQVKTTIEELAKSMGCKGIVEVLSSGPDKKPTLACLGKDHEESSLEREETLTWRQETVDPSEVVERAKEEITEKEEKVESADKPTPREDKADIYDSFDIFYGTYLSSTPEVKEWIVNLGTTFESLLAFDPGLDKIPQYIAFGHKRIKPTYKDKSCEDSWNGECVNDQLDYVIRIIHRWNNQIKIWKQRRIDDPKEEGVGEKVEFYVKVWGLANDTGDPKQDKIIAGGRSKLSIDYLKNRDGVYDPKRKKKLKSLGELGNVFFMNVNDNDSKNPLAQEMELDDTRFNVHFVFFKEDGFYFENPDHRVVVLEFGMRFRDPSKKDLTALSERTWTDYKIKPTEDE